MLMIFKMVWIYSCIGVFLLIVHTHAFKEPKSFHIKYDRSSFSVSVKGVELLLHKATDPLMFVGNGKTTFKKEHGTWSSEEQVLQKVPLSQFTITELDRVTQVRLSEPNGPEVELELESNDFNPLKVRWLRFPEGYNRVWVRLPAAELEHVYGAGEQSSRLDLRGYNYPIWTHEQGIGSNISHWTQLPDDTPRDLAMSYFPLPTFVSSRRYYCHVEGSNYVNLDFRHKTRHEITIHGTPQSLHLNAKESFEALVRAMTYFLWRQPQLPEWVHMGAILGVQGGTDQMLQYYKEAKEAGVEVSGLWIQDYTNDGHAGDPEQYADLQETIHHLKAKAVRVLTYVTPNLCTKSRLFDIAQKRGYLLKAKDGQTYLQDLLLSQCGTLDLTNPDAFKWYKGVLTKDLIEFGFGGWMADFSDHMPFDVIFHNGADARLMNNEYPVLWAQLNRQIIADAEKIGEIMFFMRAGGTGSSKYTTMTWVGDKRIDWSVTGGLPTVITAALSLGLSGVGLTHFDVRLYNRQVSLSPVGTSSPELVLRAAELAVFTAVMRTREVLEVGEGPSPTPSEDQMEPPKGNQPPANRQLEKLAALTRLYRHLSGYRMRVERQQYRGGLPMQRPLFLHYQNDTDSFTTDYQYLLGRDLLVAPVITPGVTSWEAFLPADTWEHLWSGQVYVGPRKVTVKAPIGEPPVFFRASSDWCDTFRAVKDLQLDNERANHEEL